MLTREQILAMPDADYTGPVQLEFFKSLLKDQLLATDQALQGARESLANVERPSDPVDAAYIEEQRYRLMADIKRNSEARKDILTAIQRVSENDYGWCEESGEEIGLMRLLANPTARKSIHAQENSEMRGRHLLKSA